MIYAYDLCFFELLSSTEANIMRDMSVVSIIDIISICFLFLPELKVNEYNTVG